MIRTIRQFPDSILTTPCKPADLADPNTGDICRDLIDTMAAHPACVGLSANQIGYNVRIFVIAAQCRPNKRPLVVISPTVKPIGFKKASALEGCMSVNEGKSETLVWRYLEVKLRGFTPEGIVINMRLAARPARISQHEIDHLDGKCEVKSTVTLEVQDGIVSQETT